RRAVPGDTGSKGHWFPQAHRDNSQEIAPQHLPVMLTKGTLTKERWRRNVGQGTLWRGIAARGASPSPAPPAPRLWAPEERLAAPAPHCSGSSFLHFLTGHHSCNNAVRRTQLAERGLWRPSQTRTPLEESHDRDPPTPTHRRLPVRRRSLLA